MDTQTPLTTEQENTTTSTPEMKKKSGSFGKVLLFGSIVLIALVSVALAVTLPKSSTEDRSKASTAGACIAQASVAGSACNEKCAVDQDCMSGMTCYKIGEAVEGVCRNPASPTSTTCGTATATPVAACTKACTFNYDCNLAAGESCVGTNANNPSVDITATAPRAATTTELATLASDQTIFMSSGNAFAPDSTGKMQYSVISKVATTFFVNIYDITATKGQLDPQKIVLTKSFSIGANQVVTGTVTLPHCGRYQVDYGSAIVAGTKYDANTVSHYFWGTVFEIPCQSGCCQLQTASATQSISAKADLVRLALVDPTSGKALTGYTGLTSAATITKASMPAYTLSAVSFPDAFPAGIGSVKFEVNGQLARTDNTEPYTISDVSMALPVGTYTVKATLYSLENAAGTVVDTLTTTLTVK